MYLHSISSYVDQIVDALEPSSLEVLREMAKAELGGLHNSWGLDIRNAFGLWRTDHPLTKHWHEKPEEHDLRGGIDYSLDHPDHVSMEIMKGVWQKANA